MSKKTFNGIVKDKINVLFAGRLEYQKGIDELIAVVKELKNDTHYHFHIIGAGSKSKEVQEQLGILSNVTLYDKVYGLSQYLSSFDYLFMPSNFEGFGLMCAEASLAHVPTIINNCAGLNETLPNDWLLKVDNNNTNAYVDIFKSILPKLDKVTLGNQAYHFAKKKFGIRKMQQEYEKVYQKLAL